MAWLLIISDLLNVNREKTGGLHETVAHQNYGIVHLFFLFRFPHCLSPAPFALKTKSSSWNLHAIFLIQIPLTTPAFLKKILYCQVFFIHCFTSCPPLQSAKEHWIHPSVATEKGCLLPSHTSTDIHLASLFFTREASSLVRTQCLRKAQWVQPIPEPASVWWPFWPRSRLKSGEMGVQCGFTCSSSQVQSIAGSMGLIVEKRTDSCGGEKVGKIPYRNSRGTPVSWLIWHPRWIGVSKHVLTGWKFLTKT